MRKLPIALTMLAVTAGLAISPVTASAKTQAAAACALTLGSVTAGGDHVVQRITATSPPTAAARAVTPNLYADGAAKMSGSFINQATPTGSSRYGRVVLGNAINQHWIELGTNGAVTSSKLVRIGGGWSTFTDFEHSTFNDSPTHPRTYEYALRSDGVLFRWAVGDIGDWKPYGSAPGFAAVKSMTLISKTASYDTFLANTRGGALYTIRIPIGAAMKPVVTKAGLRGAGRRAMRQLRHRRRRHRQGHEVRLPVHLRPRERTEHLHHRPRQSPRHVRRPGVLPLGAAGEVRLALRRI